MGNLLFNVKTADNRLIGGVIEAPKGIFPFGAYSFLYVLLSVYNYFFRNAVTINKSINKYINKYIHHTESARGDADGMKLDENSRSISKVSALS